MSEFRNAYHFVPRQPPQDAKPLPLDQRDQGLGADIADGHAAYAPNTRSGRITLRVTLESGTVIGGTRHSVANNYSCVEPFLFKSQPGRPALPALPATSLKGMLSSIAEVAARAPYRVLTDEKLTVAWSVNKGGWQRFRHYDGAPGGRGLTYVHDHVPAESRPMSLHAPGARRVTRGEVNPVEVMFGYVRDAATKKGPQGTQFTGKVAKGTPVSAAGKLRISHALPSGDWAMAPPAAFFLQGDLPPGAGTFPPDVKLTRLKEQGQPMKAPKRAPNHPTPPDVAAVYADLRSATPNFYFINKANPGAYVAKSDFATKPGDYAIKGTKFYLHHPDTASEPWKTAVPAHVVEGRDRKAAVAVLKPGVTFDFHIDFDNLSDHELNILCFALQPSPRFRHKIGLGRALGLGSIRIEAQSMTLIDRADRYQAARVFDPDPRTAPPQTGLVDFTTRAAAHSAWLDASDKAAKTALLAIGETHVFGDGPPLTAPISLSFGCPSWKRNSPRGPPRRPRQIVSSGSSGTTRTMADGNSRLARSPGGCRC